MSLDLATCSDGELAALTLGGRQTAFSEIMARHEAPLFRLIRGHVGDADTALDLTQDSFIAAYRALAQYDQARPLRSWLVRIAINKCRDRARRRAVRGLLSFARPLDAAINETVADSAPNAEQQLGDARELDRLWAAIATLPGNLKEPLLLRTVEELSQRETAQVLAISEKAVETRVHRARKQLEKIMHAG